MKAVPTSRYTTPHWGAVSRWHRFLALTISALITTSALAGQYVLEKGKGVEVCDAYEENLNSFDSHQSMICEREINPKIEGFKKPDWQKIDAVRTELLVWEEYELALKAMGTNLDEQRRVGHRKWMKEQIRNNVLVLREARVDIDNNGTIETVLKKQDGDCPHHRAFSVSIAVLTEDGKHYDVEKSKYINADFSKSMAKLAKDTKPESMKTAGFVRDEFRSPLLYGVFQYKDRSYFDLWELAAVERGGRGYPDLSFGRLHVFLHHSDVTREICTYRFQAQ